MGLPPAGAAVEGDAAVLRAPGPRPAAALPRRRPRPLVGRRRGHVALLRRLRRRRRGGREELLGDGGGRPGGGGQPGQREAEDHPASSAFLLPVGLRLVLRHGARNAAADGAAVEGSLGGCHGRACCHVQSHTHTHTHTQARGVLGSRLSLCDGMHHWNFCFRAVREMI